MTPAARAQAAIEVLTALENTAAPADRVLREYFRARRYAGSKDRAAVAERVFDCFRHAYSYAWRMQSAWPRRLVLASLVTEGSDPADLFTGAPYAPAPLDEGERRAIATPPADPPANVQGDFPTFLEDELTKAFGSSLLAEMAAMRARAPVDIRVNSLKTTGDDLAAALAAEGYDTRPTPLVASGLRLDGEKTSKLSASPLFAAGHFEFQDAAAQFTAQLCDARPGQRVLDYAAGAGGKALALAAAMQNRGEIVAHDIDPGRLAMIGPRAARAGVTIIRTSAAPGDHRSESPAGRGGPSGPFDRVLLDAPCSGTGTWRRQPELRVRFKPDRLAELVALQAKLLRKAAAFVAPGGRLVYATCSVLPSENDNQIAAFLDRHPDFATLPVGASDPFFHATPHRSETDGFFTAILQRRA